MTHRKNTVPSEHGHFGVGTAKQLVRLVGSKGHIPRFDKILPGTMKRLVSEGLFEPWEGSYRITAKGTKMLRELEFIEGLK